jgi:hypothetical protein
MEAASFALSTFSETSIASTLLGAFICASKAVVQRGSALEMPNVVNKIRKQN